jgi:hypothetical protein
METAAAEWAGTLPVMGNHYDTAGLDDPVQAVRLEVFLDTLTDAVNRTIAAYSQEMSEHRAVWATDTGLRAQGIALLCWLWVWPLASGLGGTAIKLVAEPPQHCHQAAEAGVQAARGLLPGEPDDPGTEAAQAGVRTPACGFPQPGSRGCRGSSPEGWGLGPAEPPSVVADPPQVTENWMTRESRLPRWESRRS